MTSVSDLRRLVVDGKWHIDKKGRWCELPPQYLFFGPAARTRLEELRSRVKVRHDDDELMDELATLSDRMGFLDKADGEYTAGVDVEAISAAFPAMIRILVPLRNGRPNVARLARNISHEWVHHWTACNEDTITSVTFDNEGVAKKADL